MDLNSSGRRPRKQRCPGGNFAFSLPALSCVCVRHLAMTTDRVVWKDINWDRVLDGDASAPFYYMRSGLVRKDVVWIYARPHTPSTTVVTSVQEVVDHVAAAPRRQAWVLKKAAGSNADGILFFHSDQVLDGDAQLLSSVAAVFPPSSASSDDAAPPAAAAATTSTTAAASVTASSAGAGATVASAPADGPKRGARPSPWILQAYVEPATVTGGHKFHIRMPVLAVGALTVFAHLNCRVLAATRPYTGSAWSDPFVHVTNRSANYTHAEYDAAAQNFSIWALSPASAAYLWSRMCRVVAAVFVLLLKSKR